MMGRTVNSDEVTGELIKAWMNLNNEVDWVKHGDSN